MRIMETATTAIVAGGGLLGLANASIKYDQVMFPLPVAVGIGVFCFSCGWTLKLVIDRTHRRRVDRLEETLDDLRGELGPVLRRARALRERAHERVLES